MIHQPLGGARGQATDIQIQAQEIVNLREITYEIMAKHTKQPRDKIERDMDRNLFMSSQEAKNYGIIDGIFDGELRT